MPAHYFELFQCIIIDNIEGISNILRWHSLRLSGVPHLLKFIYLYILSFSSLGLRLCVGFLWLWRGWRCPRCSVCFLLLWWLLLFQKLDSELSGSMVMTSDSEAANFWSCSVRAGIAPRHGDLPRPGIKLSHHCDSPLGLRGSQCHCCPCWCSAPGCTVHQQLDNGERQSY